MRRVSELILIILKSYSLPGSSGPALFSGPVDGRKLPGPSSRRLRSSISVLWQSPSMFSPNSTNAPNVAMRETFPRTMSPTLCCLNQSPQMSFTCFIPNDTRRFSGSMRSTFAVTGSPFLKTSCGFFTRPVQLTSPTCTSPSKPSSISTKAPNSAMLRTFPVTTVPMGYFSAVCIHGSGSACFMPSETRRSEEHTSELQSRRDLVCRLLLEKKKQCWGKVRGDEREGGGRVEEGGVWGG